jgi:hypothetical protein
MIGQLYPASVRAAITHTTATGASHSTVAAATAAIAAGKGPQKITVEQTGVIPAGPTTLAAFIAALPGTITGFVAKLNTAACAAGESITIELLKNATTLLAAGNLVLDNTNALNAEVASLTLVLADRNFVAGDVVTIRTARVAGGGPTPAAALIFTIDLLNT